LSVRGSRILPPPPDGIYTTKWLSEALNRVRARDWIDSQRPGNDGGIGNTLEDLIGIPENNLKVADIGEFELKAHKTEGASLVTLFHQDPLPKMKSSPVQYLLLPKYGWPHKTMAHEFSFRQTIRGDRHTDRGFSVTLDKTKNQLTTIFDSNQVDVVAHGDWLDSVRKRAGLGALSPAPFWPFDLLRNRTDAKLKNVLFVSADVKKGKGLNSFRYGSGYLLRNFRFERFLNAIENGFIYIDYDARTGHNHGTKFRIQEGNWNQIYEFVERLA